MVSNLNKQNIDQYICEEGFYLSLDEKDILVCQSQEQKKLGGLVREEEDIALVVPNQKRSVALLPLSERKITIEKNSELFCAQYDSNQKSVTLHLGKVTQISGEEGEAKFAVDNEQFLEHPGCPVFTKLNSEDDLALVGVISGTLQQVVQIESLIGEERGKKGKSSVNITYGQFQGLELRNGTSRILQITGDGQTRSYKLECCLNDRYQDVHKDKKYNDNKDNSVRKINENALKAIVNNSFQETQDFKFQRNSYRAVFQS